MVDPPKPLEDVELPRKRPPGFLKGNKEASKKLGMKYSKTQQWDNFGLNFLSKFTDQYTFLLEVQAVGDELNEAQKSFMDRYERMSEYFKPKLQRTEAQMEHSFKHLEKLQDQLKELSKPPDNAKGSDQTVPGDRTELQQDDNKDAETL